MAPCPHVSVWLEAGWGWCRLVPWPRPRHYWGHSAWLHSPGPAACSLSTLTASLLSLTRPGWDQYAEWAPVKCESESWLQTPASCHHQHPAHCFTPMSLIRFRVLILDNFKDMWVGASSAYLLIWYYIHSLVHFLLLSSSKNALVLSINTGLPYTHYHKNYHHFLKYYKTFYKVIWKVFETSIYNYGVLWSC